MIFPGVTDSTVYTGKVGGQIWDNIMRDAQRLGWEGRTGDSEHHKYKNCIIFTVVDRMR